MSHATRTRQITAAIKSHARLYPVVRLIEFRNTRAYARASLKSHRRWLAHRDSRRDRAANRLDHVTLTPGAAALAVATDTLWVPLRAQSQPRPTAPDGRPAQVVDVTLRPRFDPLANYAKLGDGVGAIARVAIWTGINIDWSKRTGRLPRDFRRLARAYARVFLNLRPFSHSSLPRRCH